MHWMKLIQHFLGQSWTRVISPFLYSALQTATYEQNLHRGCSYTQAQPVIFRNAVDEYTVFQGGLGRVDKQNINQSKAWLTLKM